MKSLRVKLPEALKKLNKKNARTFNRMVADEPKKKYRYRHRYYFPSDFDFWNDWE